MSNISTVLVTDFKVNTVTGEAFVSQRKAAELLGVSQSAISQFSLSRNYDVKEGLSSEIFSFLVTHYALDSKAATPEAKEILRKVSAAGTKAFLYHEAGYNVGVTQIAMPTDLVSALRLYADTLELNAKMDATVRQQMGVIEDQNVLMDTSKQWFTISRVKPLNPTMTFSGTKLTQESIEHGVPYKSLYAPYNMNTPNTYREDIWRLVYPEVILPLQ